MSRRLASHLLLSLPLSIFTLLAQASATGGTAPGSPQLDAHLAQWRAAHGQNWRAKADAQTGYLEMLYGGSVPSAVHPANDAQFESLGRAALESTAAMHGIDLDTLTFESAQFLPLGLVGSGDKETVRFREEVGGVRVVGGYVNVLFSARGALLSVQSTGMPGLSGFGTTASIPAPDAAAIATAAFSRLTGLAPTEVGTPELVIDAIPDGTRRTPRLSWLVNELWEGTDQEPVGWRYSVDARNGAILRTERSVHFDVSGNVTSMATPGVRPDEGSNPPAAQVMKYLRVTSPSGTVFTDANGDFNYPGVNTPLSVTFQYTNGTLANVQNQAGANYSLTLSLQPNVSNSILMNSPAVATVTAQANGLMFVDRTSDFIHSINPTDTHADFSALTKVNENSSCNAFWDGGSINFYRAGGGCVNTAYSTVVTHELGHWMNALYGTGNDSDRMGESNADVWSLYVYDNPIIGQDFCGVNCNIRNGNNNRQFCGDCCPGCYGEVHNDGEVWMGAAWKVRSRLETTNGQAAGGLIASNLFMGWMNGYNQTQIKSIIETQWMTLDDDNGNIGDGTPHFADIDGGFRQQGFPGLAINCPSPSNYCVTTPNSANPIGATMSYGGTNDISNNNFVLFSFGCPPNKTGLFFYGQTQTLVPFGNGTRCVANPFHRLPVTTTNSFGDLVTMLNLNSLPSGGQISAGQTWNFQSFFRDPAAGGAGFNASDGLQVPWCQ